MVAIRAILDYFGHLLCLLWRYQSITWDLGKSCLRRMRVIYTPPPSGYSKTRQGVREKSCRSIDPPPPLGQSKAMESDWVRSAVLKQQEMESRANLPVLQWSAGKVVPGDIQIRGRLSNFFDPHLPSWPPQVRTRQVQGQVSVSSLPNVTKWLS